jgi:hypothetical protein
MVPADEPQVGPATPGEDPTSMTEQEPARPPSVVNP